MPRIMLISVKRYATVETSNPSSNVCGHIRQRTKKFSPKVRTGCKTCRARRVKCDEAKPSCDRCKLSQRHCQGYEPIRGKVLAVIEPALFSQQGSEAERQAMFMFRTKIATLISSSLDADFWTYNLLQEAETYKTVQYAVAALAMSYHSSIITGRQTYSQKQFVLAQYNKSLNSLHQYLGKTKFRSLNQQVVVLTISLLLSYLCVIQGFPEEACGHVRSGLALLHEWNLGTPRQIATPDKTPVMVKFLVATFTRIDTQARMMIAALGPELTSPWSSHHVCLSGWGSGSKMPITNVCAQLEALHNEAVQKAEIMRSVNDDSHQAFVATEYRRQLSAWDSEFETYIENVGNPTTIIRELQIRRLLVGASWGSTDMDRLGRNSIKFKRIVDLAKIMIQESRHEQAKPVFKSSGSLIEALYFVATRCGDVNMRQEAVDLLDQYPLIEGLWESRSAAKLALRELKGKLDAEVVFV